MTMTTTTTTTTTTRAPWSPPRLRATAVALAVFAAPLCFNLTDLDVRLAFSLALVVVGVAALRADLQRGSARVGLALVAAAVVAVVSLLQLVPLPLPLADALQPGSAAALASVRAEIGLASSWRPLSLDPPATAREALFALALVGLGLAAAEARARRAGLIAAATSGVVVAAVAVGHQLVEADALFGVWSHAAMASLPSTLGNENHGALHLVAAAVIATGLARVSRGLARGAWAGAALLCLGVALRAGSRIAIVVVVVVAIVVVVVALFCSAAFARRHRAPGRVGRAAVVAAIVAVVAVAAVASSPRTQRAVRGLEPSVVFSGRSKLLLHGATLKLIAGHAALGIGRGAYETVHPRFGPQELQLRWSHIECEPLALLADLGVVAGVVVVVVVAAAAVVALRRRPRRGLQHAGAVAALGLLVGGATDFHLSFSAGLIVMVALGRPLSRPSPFASPLPRWVALAVGVGSVVVALALARAAWPGVEQARADVAALPVMGADADDIAAAVARALARHPLDADALTLGAARHLGAGDVDAAARTAALALTLAPTRGHLWLILGEAEARRGHRAEALQALRRAGGHGVDVWAVVAGSFFADGVDREAVLATAPRDARADAWVKRLRALDADPVADPVADELERRSAALRR